MRHNVKGRHLSRTTSHREATRRAVVSSLFTHERIVTTLPKAKEFAPFAEKLITLAKKDGSKLHNYRRAISLLHNKAVVKKLFDEIAPRFEGRPGGYTRILKLSKKRLGDNASQAILELVEKDTSTSKEKSEEKTQTAKK